MEYNRIAVTDSTITFHLDKNFKYTIPIYTALSRITDECFGGVRSSIGQLLLSWCHQPHKLKTKCHLSSQPLPRFLSHAFVKLLEKNKSSLVAHVLFTRVDSYNCSGDFPLWVSSVDSTRSRHPCTHSSCAASSHSCQRTPDVQVSSVCSFQRVHPETKMKLLNVALRPNSEMYSCK